jgi:DNA-binding protein HU-beta
MYSGEVVRTVSGMTRLPHDVIQDVIKATQKIIQEELRGGRSVTFPGWGTFYASKRKAGKVRSIRTGRMVDIAARKLPSFRAGSELKRAVKVK